MKDEYIKIIDNDIVPLLQNGDLTLFLGAGITAGTPTINGMGVPSTPDLIARICKEAGYSEEDAKTADLPTAFSVGSSSIENFDNFLISNFKVTKPYDWQKSIFRHWWVSVFTTNIDTMAEEILGELAHEQREYPDYKIFNYKDREPVQTIPTSPPLVYLHGSVNRIEDGFVFDNVSYADNTVKQSDWLTKCALHISHGNCLFVGSKFKESDIEAAIRQRQIWDVGSYLTSTNWIVLKSFTEMEKRSYKDRGIVPIESEAEEFFSYLFSRVEYLSPTKFIKRKAPYLGDIHGKDAPAWFYKNLENVAFSIGEAKKRTGLLSRFLYGDMPDWFYISHDVPAKFTKIKEIENEILEFESSHHKAILISVIGSLGSGKTTMVMMALAAIARTHNNIYMYASIDDFETDKVWSVIKDMKGLVVIFVDAASTYFYAINELVARVLDRPTSCKLCFVIEERTIHFERNIRHLFKIPHIYQKEYNIGLLNKENAGLLYDKSVQLGINYEKLEGKSRDEAISEIIDFDSGYKGDLLATLYDLSSRKSYKEKLSEEYLEINDDDAQGIFQTISLVTASRLSMPINYLAESHGVSINHLMKILNGELKGKIYTGGPSMTVSARHHSIAEFHIDNNFEKEAIKNRILNLMKCLSTKFDIEDIKKHPISYRIYSKILSYHYLTETLFKGKGLYHHIYDIYSECQGYFAKDGIFWLQYGRFLERDGNINDALYCFRKGLDLYDSFQIRHALGQLLLKKYRLEGLRDIEEYEEGLKLLKNEIESRGGQDPYPYTALGSELIKIINSTADNKTYYMDTLKEIINRGVNIHKEDKRFMDMTKRYLQIAEDPHVG